MRTTRTEDDVDDLLDRVYAQQDEGGSKFPGMSYEQGISEALEWLRDSSREDPHAE